MANEVRLMFREVTPAVYAQEIIEELLADIVVRANEINRELIEIYKYDPDFEVSMTGAKIGEFIRLVDDNNEFDLKSKEE